MIPKKFITGTLLCVGMQMACLPLQARIALEDTLSLTLDQALTIALSENPTIRVADREITRSDHTRRGTLASLFPQVDFSFSYQRTIEKQTMYMDVEGMSGGLKVGRDNNYSTGFTASMPLVSVPLWKSLQITAMDVDLSIEKARSSRIDLIDEVQKAYYNVLLARDACTVFKQAYDNALYNYNEIESKYGQGLVAEYDLIRASVNVKNAEPNLYDAENSLVLAHWHLKALIGVDLELEIKCVGNLVDFEDNLLLQPTHADVMPAGNSTLRQMDMQARQLEKNLQLQRAQYYPSLSLQFNYLWNSMNNDFKISDYKWDPYSVLGISVSVPLFSGGKRLSEVKKAKLDMRQLADRRTDTERQLLVATRQFTDQMHTSIKQHIAAKAGVEQAEKSYDITMRRYETGEGTMLEINDAQLSLTQARLNLNQAIYNYLVARSSLEKTMGTHPALSTQK